MKNILTNTYYKLAFRWNCRNNEKPSKKERGDQLIEVLGLVIIALVILVLFREKIMAAATTVITEIVAKLNNVFSSNTTPPTGG